MTSIPRNGRIVTFYSYKGGTGRSMALANVGWILAATGRRVLLIDWDLEAPGLHRYLHPFLSDDKELTATPGLIDFFVDFTAAARIAHADAPDDDTWFEPLASLVRYSLPITADFGDGALEFVPAGRQDAGYAVCVTGFDWQEFYDKLGGGLFLEALKKKLRHDYDFVLIDSRTGISDTSGICTVQMPDELVVLFTLNQQSIKGAAAVAESADRLRRKSHGEIGLRIWPIPTRVELAEKDRLDAAREEARLTFERYVGHLLRGQRSRYWGRVEVLYQAYYAYEEVLATFADRAQQHNSMLAKMEVIAGLLTGLKGEPLALPRMPEEFRLAIKKAFERSAKTVTAVEPAERPYAYVSYSESNLPIVLAVVERLRMLGIALWFDKDDMRVGEAWEPAINAALSRSAALIYIVGTASLSEWRKLELNLALERRLPTIPVLVDSAGPSFLPEPLRSVKAAILNLSDMPKFDADVRRLGADVAHFLRARSADTPLSIDPDDPQKGRWGGQASRNGRALAASVREISPDFFEVTLEVRTTASPPLDGDVVFHLHPSFLKPTQTVPAVNGNAVLKFVCWGSFTVGAVADRGQTTLELDLSVDSSFPNAFRAR